MRSFRCTSSGSLKKQTCEPPMQEGVTLKPGDIKLAHRIQGKTMFRVSFCYICSMQPRMVRWEECMADHYLAILLKKMHSIVFLSISRLANPSDLFNLYCASEVIWVRQEADHYFDILSCRNPFQSI